VVALLVVVAVVAGLLIATSGGGGTPAPAHSTPASNAPVSTPQPPAAPAFNPASVTVAVLNGTSTNHLARTVATKLTADGYKQGTVATAADQTLTKTVIAFMPGHRGDALHVAGSLKLQPSAVAPIDSSTQAIACPQTSPCTATVVVTVGSDLATVS
jgi:hypothetical protein